jgi:hypothetical protein
LKQKIKVEDNNDFNAQAGCSEEKNAAYVIIQKFDVARSLFMGESGNRKNLLS